MSLDPNENAVKQAQARAEIAGPNPEDQPLDPVFPYVVIKFDPTAFGRIADKEVRT